MKIIKTGSNRLVFIFKNFVIKIPFPPRLGKHRTWKNFITGILANMNEYDTWRWNKYRSEIIEKLCPIIYSNCFGLMNIMRKANLFQEEEFNNLCTEDYADVCSDIHINNFGELNGKLVVIDYGH